MKSDDEILKLGLTYAQESPCVRRKYTAQIVDANTTIVGVNIRYSNCCNEGCIRELTRAQHGGMVERGAEIHAEQAALVVYRYQPEATATFYLSGIDSSTGKELLGHDASPCHVCALMIKSAGFKQVVSRGLDQKIIRTSIDDIIRRRESEWQ